MNDKNSSNVVETLKNITASFPLHLHTTYVVGITRKGVFRSIYNNNSFVSYKFSTRVLHPLEMHGGVSKEWDYTSFYPSVELVSDVSWQIFGDNISPFFNKHIIEDKKLYDLWERFFSILYDNSHEKIEKEVALNEAMAYLILNFSNLKDKKVIFDEDVDRSIKKSIEYINDMLFEKIELDELSKIAGLSKYHFIRSFKAHIGTTPHQYILHKRVEKAKESILKGKSILEASLESGFSDQSHFTKQFKKLYGYTPKLLESSNILLYK